MMGKARNPDYVNRLLHDRAERAGGVDIYDEAAPQSVKLNDKQIPNGTAIHVLGEKVNSGRNLLFRFF